MRKWKYNSLFIRLLTGFLLIIVLFVSFQFISFVLLKNSMQKEIIKYNLLNLENSTQNYENYFLQVRNSLNSVYFNDYVKIVNILNEKDTANEMDYIVSDKVRLYIQSVISNQYLNMDNLMIYADHLDYIIEKDGVSKTNDFFSKFYISSQFKPEKWKEEFAKNQLFTVLPAMDFNEKNMNNYVYKGLYIPVIITNFYQSSLTIVALSDANKLFQLFHHSSNNNFHIMDANHTMLFTSNESLASQIHIPENLENGYILKNNQLYFYKKGQNTRFTYIDVVPSASITAQIFHLKIASAGLVITSILFGAVFSFWFVTKINNPLKKMVAAIQQTNGPLLEQTPIHEFNMITEKIRTTLINDEEVSKKDSIIMNYAYMNKLNRIQSKFFEYKELIFSKKPYVFVLFDIVFLPSQEVSTEINEERAASFIRAFIEAVVSQNFQESITFQMEKDQILSLLFVSDDPNQLSGALDQIKKVLEVDSINYFLTISVSSTFTESSDMPAIYEEIRKRISFRPLGEDTIILWETPASNLHSLIPFQEEEFMNNLLVGKEYAIQVVLNYLQEMKMKEQSSADFQRFSMNLVNKAVQAITIKLPNNQTIIQEFQPYEKVMECRTLDQYAIFFNIFLTSAIQQFKEITDNYDSMISFVKNYVEEYPEKEISLDLLADKLNITGSYLSTYFKDKTGMNLSDYVNGVRLGKAKTLLLENNDRTIQHIGELVGFYNANTFIRNFKKYLGLTPGEFRKKFGSVTLDKKDE